MTWSINQQIEVALDRTLGSVQLCQREIGLQSISLNMFSAHVDLLKYATINLDVEN